MPNIIVTFSKTVGQLVNSALSNYNIRYLSVEEAISKAYLNTENIDSSIDTKNAYFAIISGDAMLNSKMPYMTEYEKRGSKGFNGILRFW